VDKEEKILINKRKHIVS